METAIDFIIYLFLLSFSLWLVVKKVWPASSKFAVFINDLIYIAVSDFMNLFIRLFKLLQPERIEPDNRWRVIRALEEMNAELDARNAKADTDFFFKESLKQGRQ